MAVFVGKKNYIVDENTKKTTATIQANRTKTNNHDYAL